IVNYSEKARREGLLSLEDDLGSMDDVFLKKALELVVDGTDPEVVRNVMQIEIDNLEARHHHNRMWFEQWSTLAPGFALMGTLIGLVSIFANLSGGDMAVLGHGLAAAFLNTFYGTFIANVFALPMAGKLKALSEEEVLMRQVLLEGTLSIQAGDNPRIVKDKLLGFLKPGERKEIEDEVKT
ncbi:MAG: MotA/TolQ/ExbB proton channel family protein, partial [Spirochaetia bacterium]|nr:MotA/TolQ/ExbB proton channel family protein [Spirochaetia bacterium]